MSMQETIMEDLKAAMRAGEKDKLEVLRMVKTALQMAEIDERGDFDDAKQLKIVAREAKKRREAAQMFIDGNDQVRADKELAEAAIIDAYLPQMMPEAEIEIVVDEVIAEVGGDNVGTVMGKVMGKLAGKADGSVVSRIVKAKLG